MENYVSQTFGGPAKTALRRIVVASRQTPLHRSGPPPGAGSRLPFPKVRARQNPWRQSAKYERRPWPPKDRRALLCLWLTARLRQIFARIATSRSGQRGCSHAANRVPNRTDRAALTRGDDGGNKEIVCLGYGLRSIGKSRRSDDVTRRAVPMNDFAITSDITAKVSEVPASQNVGLYCQVRDIREAMRKGRRDQRDGKQGNQNDPAEGFRRPLAHPVI